MNPTTIITATTVAETYEYHDHQPGELCDSPDQSHRFTWIPPPCRDALMPTPPSSQSCVDTMTTSQGCLNHTISTVTRYMTSTISFAQSRQCHDKCCRVVGTPWWASQTMWTQPLPTSQGRGNTRPPSHCYLTTTSTIILVVCEYHDQPHRVTRTTPATTS